MIDNPAPAAGQTPARRPPRAITVIRVLLVITGFTSMINGLLELDPDGEVSTRAFGWFLIVLGVTCWALTWALRKPGRGQRTALLVLLVVLVAVRIYQMIRFSTLLPATGLILPVLVYLRMRGGAVRAWFDPLTVRGTAMPIPPRPRTGLAKLGAVGITTVLLVALTVAGAAVTLWPCSFPEAASSGLDQSQSPTSLGGAPTGQFPATDGVPLAYYAFVPPAPVATLVFYHGSGANSAAGYLPLGQQLAERYHVATYLIDIRGHGGSGGPRGDTPSIGQLWQDTATAVDFVHHQQPDLPEYVGGHSAGAGLVLNSLDLFTEPIAGYAFLAPDFGLNSGTTAQSGAGNFATVCTRPLVVNALSNHVLDGHTPAVGFAYTREEIDRAGLVARYTVNMAVGQNPGTSSAVLAGLKVPIGVWIGTDDEVFDAGRTLAYARRAGSAAVSTFATVPGDNHLGILANGADAIGPWITRGR